MHSNEKSKDELIEALHETQERLDNLFEGSGDSILLVDVKDSKILQVNSNVIRRLGYNQKEILDMTFDELIFDRESTDNMSWTSTFSGTNVYECKIRRKDGILIPVEICSRLAKYNKQPVFQNSVRELIVRKQFEKEKLDLKIERERREILASFLSQSSHEFRTPLSIIKLSAHMLNSATLTLEDRRTHVNKIDTNVDYITHLIDTMNTLVRLDKINEITMKKVDLIAMLVEVVDYWKANLSEINIQFNVDGFDLPILISGNNQFLIQAINELVKNAATSMMNSGTIHMFVEQLEGNKVKIKICDTGVGIESKHLPHIFKYFYRIDNVGTTRGFGLGLPVANRIIDLHGGDINLESDTNSGTIVEVTLPSI